MITPTRADLLGYLLGALDGHEQQQVEALLQSHTELQLELQRIKAQLRPLQCCQKPPAELPVGLARRTCESVSRQSRLAEKVQRQIGEPQAEAIERCDSAVEAIRPPCPSVRPMRSVALACFAAVCGALLGPPALRAIQSRPDVLTPASAIADHPVRPSRPSRSRPDPMLRSEILDHSVLASFVEPDGDSEPVLTNSFFAQTSQWHWLERPRIANASWDRGLFPVASGPSPHSFRSISDSWDIDPGVQFVAE